MVTEVPTQIAVLDAVRGLAHATMRYRCEDCGYVVEIWLALGVEGPEALREAKLYVPCPFTARCVSWKLKDEYTEEERKIFQHLEPCTGTLSHVEWNLDRSFAPRPMPLDVPRFVLSRDYDCGTLVWPKDALVKARRYHHERLVA